MNSLRRKNIEQLKRLIESLNHLGETNYSKSLDILSQSSLGQHFRHIIEFYQILKKSTKSGIINYDKRERHKDLEECLNAANIATAEIINWLEKDIDDRYLKLRQMSSGSTLDSSLKRELQYVYEHTTHHMAIIKIAMRSINPDLELNGSFGVADSTVAYQSK